MAETEISSNSMKTSRIKRIISTVLFALVLIILTCSFYVSDRGGAFRAWRLLGQRNINILQHPDKVTIYRVEWGMIPGKPIIAGCSIIGTSEVAVPNVGTTILDVYNTKPYLSGGEPDCVYDPGVVMQFVKDGETVNAVVCYECANIALRSSSGVAWSGNFNGAHAEMIGLAKKAFPNDKEIQLLVEH